MQEETNEKTIALYIKTGKLTAQQLQKGYESPACTDEKSSMTNRKSRMESRP